MFQNMLGSYNRQKLYIKDIQGLNRIFEHCIRTKFVGFDGSICKYYVIQNVKHWGKITADISTVTIRISMLAEKGDILQFRTIHFFYIYVHISFQQLYLKGFPNVCVFGYPSHLTK